MRDCFLDPVASHPALPEAQRLSLRIYALHEAGSDYSVELQQLGRAAGRVISRQQVFGAFGSISPETFARKVLVNWNALPVGATEAEMLELICQAKGSEFQVEYWVQCLRANTGDERISDLIFWPDEYFGRAIEKEMSAKEILAVALGRAANGEA